MTLSLVISLFSTSHFLPPGADRDMKRPQVGRQRDAVASTAGGSIRRPDKSDSQAFGRPPNGGPQFTSTMSLSQHGAHLPVLRSVFRHRVLRALLVAAGACPFAPAV